MSMHEIEDLVADSIRLVYTLDPDIDTHRDVFFGLLQFQRGFDCKFTHGRMLEALITRRFSYRLPLDAHPAYAAHRTAFDAAGHDDIVFVGSEIVGDEDDDTGDEDDDDTDGHDVDDGPRGIGHEQGYLIAGQLHVDAGTPLWQTLVERGTLAGADARAPIAPSLGSLALRVARLAEQRGDRDLIAMWINFGPLTLFPARRRVRKGEQLAINPFSGKPILAPRDAEIKVPPDPAHLAANPEAVELRALGQRCDVASMTLHYDYRPPREMWSDGERWWWGDTRARDPGPAKRGGATKRAAKAEAPKLRAAKSRTKQAKQPKRARPRKAKPRTPKPAKPRAAKPAKQPAKPRASKPTKPRAAKPAKPRTPKPAKQPAKPRASKPTKPRAAKPTNPARQNRR